MEESGHYYTVYFTSLSVGFDPAIAYRHAVLAQMPDQVNWLDAAHMHILQCRSGSEVNLSGREQAVDRRWRYSIEYGLHSLPDWNGGHTSSEFQRTATRNMLNAEDPASLKFGLLLHRLGDTYAHSIMGNEKEMYTVTRSGRVEACFSPYNIGHARHMHDPDYPFLRTGLFDQYLTDLYTVLNNKARDRANAHLVRRSPVLSLDQIKAVFKRILTDPHGRVQETLQLMEQTMQANQGGVTPTGPYMDRAQIHLIQAIREASVKYLGIAMESYQPERSTGRTLPQFLREHRELAPLQIDETKINDAVRGIQRTLETAR